MWNRKQTQYQTENNICFFYAQHIFGYEFAARRMNVSETSSCPTIVMLRFIGRRQIYKISHVTSRMIMYNNKNMQFVKE